MTGLVTTGTIGTGVWQGTPITSAYLNPAQTAITSVGTLTNFRSTGIDDNADATAITIDSSERVGIGISSSITDALHVKTTAVETRISLESSTGKWAIGAEDGDKFGILNYGTSTPFIIDSSGKVGIGTASPEAPLMIFGSNVGDKNNPIISSYTPVLLIDSATTNDTTQNAIAFVKNYSGDKYIGASIAAESNYADASGVGMDIVFLTNRNDETDGGLQEAVRIAQGGNVGIGTASPGAKIDIQSGAGITALFGADVNAITRSDNTRKFARIGGYHYSNEEQPIGFMVYDCQSDTDARIYIGGGDSNVNAATSLTFYTAANATTTTGTIALTIDSSQNATFAGTASISSGGSHDSTTPNVYANELVIRSRNQGNGTGITILSETDEYGTLYFGDGGTSNQAYRGYIQYGHSADQLELASAGNIILYGGYSTTLTLDSSQHATFAKHISTGGTYSLRSYGVGVFGGTNTEQIEMFHNGAGTGGGRIEVKAAGSGSSRSLTLWTGGSIGFTLDASQNGTFSGRLKTDTDAEDVAYWNSDHANGMYMVFQNAGSTFGYLGSAKSLIAGGNSITDVTLRSNNTLFLVAGGGGEDVKIEANGDSTFAGKIKHGSNGFSLGGSVGRIIVYGTSGGDNYLYVGNYNDNGWGYVESINNGNGLYFNTNEGHFHLDNGSLLPYDDNEIDIGSTGRRFGVIHAVTGTINTSDKRHKDNIKASSLGLEFLNKLNPVQYKFKDYEKFKRAKPEAEEEFTDEVIKHTHKRTHYGLIAQEVEKVLTDSGMTTEDFAPLTYDEEADLYGMRYSEYVGILIKAVQELSDKVTTLENA
jgi:hypothetical protein